MTNYFQQPLDELYELDENKRSELNTFISKHHKPIKLIVLTSIFAGAVMTFIGFSIFFEEYAKKNIVSYPDYLSIIFLIIGAALLVPTIIFFVKLMNRLKENNESNDKIRDLQREVTEIERVIDIKKSSMKSEGKAATQQQASNIDLILKYKQLLDAGAITKEEYEAKKKELLSL